MRATGSLLPVLMGQAPPYRHLLDSNAFTLKNKNTAVVAKKKIKFPVSMIPREKSVYLRKTI